MICRLRQRDGREEKIIDYKTLVVHVDDSDQCDARIDVACRLACDFGAKLLGVYLVSTAALTPSVSALLPKSFVEERLRESGMAQEAAEERFREACKAAGVPACEWRAPAGIAARALVLNSRGGDLVIIGQPDPGAADVAFKSTLANAAVLSSGRPVLVIPYVGAETAVGQTVMVALDDGRESARALADALPLLTRARKVILLSFADEDDETLEHAQTRSLAASFLAGHDIEAEVHHLDLPDIGIGEMLLSQAADFGVDLLVMGAYGHTRLHELVLGGVTRTMLESMTVPVLMSH